MNDHTCHYIIKFEKDKVYKLCTDCDEIIFEKKVDELEKGELEKLFEEEAKE